MRLKSVAIEGYRGAKDRIELKIDPDFTILSGQNDAGKSTFLEGLKTFFDGSKLDQDDFHMSKDGRSETAYIEVTFDNLPDDVILDAKYRTSFASEYLTNGDGELTIRHTFSSGKISKSLRAKHPVLKENGQSLLAMTNKALKDLATSNSIDLTNCNKTINAQLRQSIYQCTHLFDFNDHFELEASLTELKSFFPKLEKNYPVFHLFSAENVSDEGEKYVQDPVKVIVRQVIERYKNELDQVAERINEELKEALSDVSDELELLAPTLKTSFSPHNVDAKWEKAYQAVAFHDADNVPLATRGSGMRRLALLSFFRVNARESSKGRSVIFAVEEPEVFLHPDLQREVWNALTDLAAKDDSQVVITSHSSNLISKTHVTQVRYLSGGVVEQVESLEDRSGVNDFVAKIEQSLGKFRDSNVDCFLLVEGKNDIITIEGIAENPPSKDLGEFSKHVKSGRVLVLPIGGTGSVGLWGGGRLKPFSKPVVFLRDRDDHVVTSDSKETLLTKFKTDDFFEVYHSRREMENLLSVNFIVDQLLLDWQVDEQRFREALDFHGLNDDNMIDCDVPVACSQAFFYVQLDGEMTSVQPEKLKSKESSVKKILAKAYSCLDDESTRNLMDSNFGSLVCAINELLRPPPENAKQ